MARGLRRCAVIRRPEHAVLIKRCRQVRSVAPAARPKDVTVPKSSKRFEAVKAHAWFMYILRCSDGSLYTGITTDVKRRSEQHNAGTAARYTRTRLPIRVEYQESHTSRSSALKREWAVKAMARLEKESLIRQANQRRR